ncbi:hypothetical protein F1188_07460 [Roseospira marina]|uniref:Ribosomal RNA small subunit methyltransferase G n=1 Tax=Roseospira marina TaxID=140057 RepID=A0A5M6IEQ7_9PROT|nr:RsmG family class I SAM-dependent methyltransferase [Roseospira marina]KAA5606249.1 hypothetical protein F1188_07460 [Roseospira marina]MBB4314403.1 16S rRNA (guanine527-N7)-methyltransferase [Roseospira marina]MBB5087563.1 16S rRNA (guanine527-N7)-methyltransferase [Roseospira marina]
MASRSRPPGPGAPRGRRGSAPPREPHTRAGRDRASAESPSRPPARRSAPALALPAPEARRAGLAAVLGRSPETIPETALDRLTTLLELLETWTRRINLVGPATVPDAWARHVLDSARLVPLIPPGTTRLADLGSGAGFPGLVLAILGASDGVSDGAPLDVHLVESDQRKVAFLREAARVTDTPVTLHAQRIEAVAPLEAAVVTARALAPLPDLLPLVTRHLTPEGVALLPKGRTAADELTACADQWIMRVDRCPRSVPPESSAPSSPSAAASNAAGNEAADETLGSGPILILREIRRVVPDT